MKKIYRIFNVITLIIIAILLASVISIPSLVRQLVTAFDDGNFNKERMEIISTLLIYTTYIPFVLVVYYLRKICKCMSSENPFVSKVSPLLTKISVISYLEAIFMCLLIILFCYFNRANKFMWLGIIYNEGFIVLLFVLVGLLCNISKGVYLQAINIKDENDKTI